MNHCDFKFGLTRATVYGGPYRECPEGAYGVNMAAELRYLPSKVQVPTEDFQTPDPDDLLEGLRQTILALGAKQQVYVGCMGGIGRTGLFLAVLAKALGYETPVTYIRANYLSYAVETEQQQRYVDTFDVSGLKSTVFHAKLMRALLFWKKEPSLS